MIARFRDERLSLNLSGATVIKDLNTLSHIIDTAIKEWGLYISQNPVKNIRKPRVNNSRSRRLSNEEEIFHPTHSFSLLINSSIQIPFIRLLSMVIVYI
jgi:hypothetical protein